MKVAPKMESPMTCATASTYHAKGAARIMGMYAPRWHKAARKKVEHGYYSRAIEMSAEVTSGGRSSKSTRIPSSLTLTKVKEVWERLADGVGMGRLRLAGSAEVGLYGSAEVLLPEGKGEDGLVDGPGECSRMGVET